ncbi:hypothetical protein [Pelagibacterium limicola]|uniref:hypothetical protein n=1 Tax=Pelagibacterium limicola TaxID=2791022 RepID=UPI0018AFCE86|nr:hypothetical protein [Pelagibacterium limicola]
MNDSKPDLTTTEMRQGNRRRMNLRVLVIGIALVVIGFALALWYNTAMSPGTVTTTGAGETLEETMPGETLEELPTPAPVSPGQ